MADININANGCSNSKNFPKAQTSISWHSAKACTVTFSPVPNCFGNVSSITFPPDDQTLSVVQNPPTTAFTTPCDEKDTYDITFTNPKKKKAKKEKKAAKVKTAAKKAPAKKVAAKKPTAKKAPAKKASAKLKAAAKRKR
jgi:hypothetical protein